MVLVCMLQSIFYLFILDSLIAIADRLVNH